MKLGKLENGQVTLVTVELGHEMVTNKTEEELYTEGYKKACVTEKPSSSAIEQWIEFPDFLLQTWEEPEGENEDLDPDEISDEEALRIIMGVDG